MLAHSLFILYYLKLELLYHVAHYRTLANNIKFLTTYSCDTISEQFRGNSRARRLGLTTKKPLFDVV